MIVIVRCLSLRLDFLEKSTISRISRLVKAGLASRQRGKYSLTMLGQIVYQAQLAIDHAVDISPKLKAVDMLKNSSNIPEGERNKVINFLLSNELSKNILLQRSWSSRLTFDLRTGCNRQRDVCISRDPTS